MRTVSLVASLIVVLSLLPACRSTPDYARGLAPGESALLPLAPGEPLPDVGPSWHDREDVLEALERSRVWLERRVARDRYPIAGIEHRRALASVTRLGQLLRESPDAESFTRSVHSEFVFYKSAGWDGRGGGVLFTGYYTPIFDARLEPDTLYRYPLYSKPEGLVRKPDGTVVRQLATGSELPAPTRRALEETDMLRGRGLELAYLKDPFDAYLCHVQGSAFLHMKDGTMLKLGFGGTNGREYTSLAKELVKAGEIPEDHSGIPALRTWAERNRERLFDFTRRNERFIFFTQINGTPHGSLDFPVSQNLTLATDKSLFPPAAPVFVDSSVANASTNGFSMFRQIMFDQDTGGGIRTAGRGDIYLGIGDDAGRRAGRTKAEGQLYYFFLEPELVGLYSPRAGDGIAP